MGVNHSTKGTETVNAISNLALLTGNIGRDRRRAVLDHRPVQRHGHARGGLHVEHCPATASSRTRPIARAGQRCGTSTSPASRPSAAWPIPTSSKPPSTGKHPRAVDHRHQPGGVVTRTRARCARRSATWSSWWCRTATIPRPPPSSPHLVLPAAIWGEKEGTYTNSERRVSKVNKAVDPIGEARLRLRHLPCRSPTSSACKDEIFPGWTGRRRLQ